MISSLKLNDNKKELSRRDIKTINDIVSYQNLIGSTPFWIYSIYFFLSITLLTSVHMYEYLKCIFC